jgi:hypothetical protein
MPSEFLCVWVVTIPNTSEANYSSALTDVQVVEKLHAQSV